MNEHKLDNPLWFSLVETHRDKCIDYNGVKCYHPGFCPFGAFRKIEHTTFALDQYVQITNNFYIVGNQPQSGPSIILKKELVCNQMILESKIEFNIIESIIELTPKQYPELFDLVNLVQPGYFKNKTAELGHYYGIYKHDKLLEVTGERMKMNDYTEVSAVVTHPDHTGNGYAKQLLTHATNKIFESEQIPYLHVASTNIHAIKIYENLGFKTRRMMSFWQFEKTN